jgi:hypothetical protein
LNSVGACFILRTRGLQGCFASRERKVTPLKSFNIFIVCMLFSILPIIAQEKGVDTQNQTIRDTSTNRQPGKNGTNQSGGRESGMDFGKGKTPPIIVLPNPYRLTGRKDGIVKSVEELMKVRKLIPDTSASKPLEGIIVSQPYTFIRGNVVAQSEISRYADVPTTQSRGWSRGRYVLIVEVQPIDGVSCNVSVNSKIEARSDGASGAEWTSLVSNGTLEQEFLSVLIENITGNSPAAKMPDQP